MGAVTFKDQPRSITEAGELLPGGSLWFTVEDTDDDTPAYADGAFRTPLPNPLVSDGAGRLAPFWLDPLVSYRGRLLHPVTGAVVWDQNPITVLPLTDSGQPLDDDGATIPFATLTFWRSGTTALQPIYTDSGMGTELDNPQTADIDGIFGAIILDNELDYRVKLQRADATLIYDIDPLQLIPDPAATFETALSSASANGTNFTAPIEWAFGTGNFTCEFWFNPGDGIDNEQFRVLRARSSSGAQSGWEVQVRATGTPNQRVMRLLLRPSSTSFTFTSSTITVTDATWNHYAFVIDRGAATVTFYVNGDPAGSTSIASAGGGAVGLATSMSIMQSISGSVDELRVWNVARSAADILANYAIPFADPASETNLIADWQFNEGSGTTTTETILETVATIVSGGTFVPGPTP